MALEQIAIPASTNIAAVSYDPDELTLLVTFNNGSVYRYLQVDGGTARGFSQAPSAGKYFQAFVKNMFDVEQV